MELEELSNIIGSIYDCSINPDLWEPTLESVRSLMQCANAQLSLFDYQEKRILLSRSTGIERTWLDLQADYNQELYELWAPVVLDPSFDMNEAKAGRREISTENWQSNGYVEEWCRPQGLVDVLAFFLVRTESRVATIGMGRHESVGLVSDEALRIATLLVPHLRRAITISDMLNVAKLKASDIEAGLDLLSAGVFLVDCEARLLHANRRGQDMIRMADAIRIENAKLKAIMPASAMALNRAISLAGINESAIGKAGIGVPLPGRTGRAHVAHVLPLRQEPSVGSSPQRNWARGAVAAVFVSPSDNAGAFPNEALSAIYGLTPTETRVALAIASGQTLSGIAESMTVVESTVKKHLIHIFEKTNTSRQVDLALLIHSLSAPVLSV